MSYLLFDEAPLTINTKLASLIGLNEAIVLQQIHYWLQINQKANINFKDGHYWTYNSLRQWKESNFDFWSYDTVKRTFKNLEKKNLIITNNYNKKKYDQTKWYTINYDQLNNIIPLKPALTAKSANCPNHKEQIAPIVKSRLPQPIPETTTEITTEIKKSSQSQTKEQYQTPDTDQTQTENIIKDKKNVYQNFPTAVESKGKKDKQNKTIINYNTYLKKIKENICYDSILFFDCRNDLPLIDEFINNMLDVICSEEAYIQINKQRTVTELVKSIYLKINCNDFKYCLLKLKKVSNRITKKSQYIKTLLYNCKLEINSTYTNLLNINSNIGL